MAYKREKARGKKQVQKKKEYLRESNVNGKDKKWENSVGDGKMLLPIILQFSYFIIIK